MQPFARVFALLVAALLPLAAGCIDVTAQTFAYVHPGAQIEIQFGVWNYGWNNPGYSPYPTEIGLELIGQPAAGSLFDGWLESLDGTVSAPFSLSVSPGSFSAGGGSTIDVTVIAGSVFLPEPTSQLLFGANIGNYNSAARFRLLNLGDGFTLGIGPGYTVRNAVSEPGIGGDGPVHTAGITGKVVVSNPEPSTWLLLVGAIGLLVALHRIRRRVS